MFGSDMGGTQAELSGSVPLAALLGLPAGTAAGFVGSLLHGLDGGKTHRFRTAPRPLETSLGDR
ncbi:MULTISPECIES: hypothetical protein [unclassified Streptomyces]|uniref:hypothetical protein n=1 Tax=unclassified Streptomyces TaxID=2593676 RepID=UPI002366DD46|nr:MULTISPECIES: hypothetical protein [unclassified Streptomyces]MDF3141373.1 hypothetical protein [Streptomyces sp. T21Q-yed]WDF38850.1 hypothetical protein PBV52_19625 [Streptomyces sp. T12]